MAGTMDTMAMNPLLSAFRRWLNEDHPKVVRRRLLVAIPLLLLAWYVFGGQQGLFALAMSQREKTQLRAQIAELEADNTTLKAQADALANNPLSCEKTAREQLQLMRPGEIIYRFQ